MKERRTVSGMTEAYTGKKFTIFDLLGTVFYHKMYYACAVSRIYEFLQNNLNVYPFLAYVTSDFRNETWDMTSLEAFKKQFIRRCPEDFIVKSVNDMGEVYIGPEDRSGFKFKFPSGQTEYPFRHKGNVPMKVTDILAFFINRVE